MTPGGANAGPLDLLRSAGPGLAALLRRRLRRRSDAPGSGPATASEVRERMDAYWRSLGAGEAARRDWLRTALESPEYAEAHERCQRVWGPLDGARVVDFGCGWGSLSVEFAKHGARMTFIDHVAAHVEVTRLRVPGGRGFVYDGRDLTLLLEEIGRDFDYVLLNSVIEHVVPPGDHRGDAASSLEAKACVLREAARLLKPGGGLYLSTGNYAFPLDGEVKTWFFHWLPAERQRAILAEMEMDADRYGLLRWEELQGLAEGAGLALDRVDTLDIQGLRPLLVALSVVSRAAGYRLPRREIDALVDLMAHDPRFMPAWFVFYRRRP